MAIDPTAVVPEQLIMQALLGSIGQQPQAPQAPGLLEPERPGLGKRIGLGVASGLSNAANILAGGGQGGRDFLGELMARQQAEVDRANRANQLAFQAKRASFEAEQGREFAAKEREAREEFAAGQAALDREAAENRQIEALNARSEENRLNRISGEQQAALDRAVRLSISEMNAGLQGNAQMMAQWEMFNDRSNPIFAGMIDTAQQVQSGSDKRSHQEIKEQMFQGLELLIGSAPPEMQDAIRLRAEAFFERTVGRATDARSKKAQDAKPTATEQFGLGVESLATGQAPLLPMGAGVALQQGARGAGLLKNELLRLFGIGTDLAGGSRQLP